MTATHAYYLVSPLCSLRHTCSSLLTYVTRCCQRRSALHQKLEPVLGLCQSSAVGVCTEGLDKPLKVRRRTRQPQVSSLYRVQAVKLLDSCSCTTAYTSLQLLYAYLGGYLLQRASTGWTCQKAAGQQSRKKQAVIYCHDFLFLFSKSHWNQTACNHWHIECRILARKVSGGQQDAVQKIGCNSTSENSTLFWATKVSLCFEHHAKRSLILSELLSVHCQTISRNPLRRPRQPQA